MDRGAWQATVHGVARVRHNLATKPPSTICIYIYVYNFLNFKTICIETKYFVNFLVKIASLS